VGKIATFSNVYLTAPQGGGRQHPFLNMALLLDVQSSSAVLLRKFRGIERAAGRRQALGRRWGPRPLDIDLIDHGGRVSDRWSQGASATRGKIPSKIILPHASSHLRAFVLVPVLEICPNWWHPALRVPGKRLLQRLPRAQVASVLVQCSAACDSRE
jgi:2-amino-4-hydroxy-6-hydroxymethyldihydropteridine diphosphokinase